MELRTTSALALACALLACGGCGLWYGVGKATGLVSPPKFVVRETMPEDFRLGVSVRDATDPPTDYTLTFERTGKVAYDVLVRAPRRRQQIGEFEITEDQVQLLWREVAQAKFDEIPERIPEHGDGTDATAGVQRYYVFADGTERRVETYFQLVEGLETVRMAALAAIPLEILSASGAPGSLPDRPKEFVGDAQTRRFHLPSCPLLKGLPAERRHPFGTSQQALDFQFDPCRECEPLKTR